MKLLFPFQLSLVDESLDNSEYVKRDALELNDLRHKLFIAQNDILEKETTISKITEEVERLLESSALVNAKINLLENDLAEEKIHTAKFKKEAEKLKQELMFTQQLANTTSNEELMMKAKIENLSTELKKRPTVESFEDLKLKCSNLEKIFSKIRTNDSGDIYTNDSNSEVISKCNEIENERLTELEEELVLIKERYAECNLEKIQLNRNLDTLQKRYNEIVNRSHNIVFLYMAPLILLVAYLLLSSMFS